MANGICRFPIAASLVLFAGCALPPSPDGGATSAEAIARFYEVEKGCPHCSVAVVRGDEASFGGDPCAIYRIGSLTKLFLRPAFERLHSAGTVDLDSPVSRSAPFRLPSEYDAVTLRNLMDCRSGLPRDFLDPASPLDAARAISCGLFGTSLYASFEEIGDFADALAGDRSRRFVRDGGRRYSNVGFALLALSVQNVAGRAIDDIFAEEVARPLGLRDTTFTPSAGMSYRVTPLCAGDLPWMFPRGSVVPEHPLGSALRGTGALFSSAADCARFFHGEWAYVDSLTREKPLALCTDGEDRGLLRVKILPSGRRVLFRAGMIYGGASFVCFEPEVRLILVVLRNVTAWPCEQDFSFADVLTAHAG